MGSNTSKLVARLLWIFPVLLILLSVYQLDVALDLRKTLRDGIPATAQITNLYSSDRVDVSYDYISIRVELEDGRVIEKEEMSLPHSFIAEIEGLEEIPVRVLPGSDQEVVIEKVGRAHWRIAAINASISFLGFVLSFIAINAWNRYLSRKGDPGHRTSDMVDDAEISSTA